MSLPIPHQIAAPIHYAYDKVFRYPTSFRQCWALDYWLSMRPSEYCVDWGFFYICRKPNGERFVRLMIEEGFLIPVDEEEETP